MQYDYYAMEKDIVPAIKEVCELLDGKWMERSYGYRCVIPSSEGEDVEIIYTRSARTERVNFRINVPKRYKLDAEVEYCEFSDPRTRKDARGALVCKTTTGEEIVLNLFEDTPIDLEVHDSTFTSTVQLPPSLKSKKIYEAEKKIPEDVHFIKSIEDWLREEAIYGDNTVAKSFLNSLRKAKTLNEKLKIAKEAQNYLERSNDLSAPYVIF